MLYAKIDMDTNLVLEFPIFEFDLRNKHFKGTTLPNVISDFALVGTSYRCVEPRPVDEVNLVPTFTHSIEHVCGRRCPCAVGPRHACVRARATQ